MMQRGLGKVGRGYLLRRVFWHCDFFDIDCSSLPSFKSAKVSMKPPVRPRNNDKDTD
jgi:hypothetical protein